MVTAAAAPAPTIANTGSLSACAGNSVALSTGSFSSYQWLSTGTVVAGATTNTFGANASGQYSVIVTNASGCIDTSAAVTVTIHPLPVPVITENAHTLSTGSNYTGYQWSFNGTHIPSSTADTLSTLANGNGAYIVTVTDSNGCTGISASFTVSDVSVPSVTALGNAMKLYPNPAADMIYIDAPVKVNVTIAGTDGRKVMHTDNAKSMNINGLANGLYLIMIYDANNNLVKTDKLVKNN